ncbi:TetR family transcriptional regulator C-terminal domain-containing protein [Microbacterium sp. NPDC089695]|uniref:TetR family transcriptional regulator C-terminal domain-containing protein n=1 Tax=Microbacterium sp. NPDC089695 TaxID=3364198 RepID=UPI0037F291E4
MADESEQRAGEGPRAEHEPREQGVGVGEVRQVAQVWGQAMTEPGMREILWEVFADLRDVYATHFAAWAEEREGLDPEAARDWAQTLLPVAIGLGQGFLVQSALLADFDHAAYLEAITRFLPHDEPRLDG